MRRTYEVTLTFWECVRFFGLLRGFLPQSPIYLFFIWQQLTTFFLRPSYLMAMSVVLVIALPAFFLLWIVSTYPRNLRVSFEEEGLQTEWSKGASRFRETQFAPWSELRNRGSICFADFGVSIVLPPQAGRFSSMPMMLPRRVFVDHREFEELSRYVDARLDACSEHVEHAPLFDFKFEADSQIDPPWERGAISLASLFVFCRIMAINTLIFSVVALLRDVDSLWDRWVYSSGVLVTAIFLAFPDWWARRARQWFNARRRYRILVDGESIELEGQRFLSWQVVSHRIKLPWSQLRTSGVCEESSAGFLFEYPRQRNRIPTRTCWIPKRAFESPAQLREFRDFAEAKMHGAQLPEPQEIGL